MRGASLCIAHFLVFLFLTALPNPATAQGVYNEIPVESSSHGPVVIALFDIETFLGPLPARVIVVDTEGIIIAVTPVGHNVRLHCNTNALASCSAYDPSTSTLYQTRRDAEHLDLSLAALTQEFRNDTLQAGFRAKRLGPLGQIKQSALFALRAPVISFVAILWWAGLGCVFALLIFAPLRRLLSNEHQASFFAEMVRVILGIILFGAMVAATLLSFAFITPAPFGTFAFAVFGFALFFLAQAIIRSILD